MAQFIFFGCGKGKGCNVISGYYGEQEKHG